MKKTLFIIAVFYIQPILLVGQIEEVGISESKFTFKPDSSLKSITEYWVSGKDSSKTAKYFYSNGRISLKETYNKDTLISARTYKYTKDGLLSLAIETSYEIPAYGITKRFVFFKYDQYKNPYFKQIYDSTKYDGVFDIKIYQKFWNYIYEDSIKYYSNSVTNQSYGWFTEHEKFEYNTNKKLVQVLSHSMSDTTDNYYFTSKYSYDKNGNLTKEYYANGDSTVFEYDFKNRLVRISNEWPNSPGMPFSGDSGFQKTYVNYIYNKNEKLSSVFYELRQHNDPKKYYINHYYFQY